MSQSMDSLASYLEEKLILREEFAKDGYSAEQIGLLKAKGVYPYEYTDSFKIRRITAKRRSTTARGFLQLTH